MRFTGFPERGLVFYDGLEVDNSKTYWTDNRAVYDECVKEPMDALLAELAPEFGEAKFFRPYRDVRFAKDKAPYKTHAGAVVHGSGGGGLYVQVSAAGLLLAGGAWHLESDQVQRMRAAIADDDLGPALEQELGALRKSGWTIGGNPVKTRPHGYDKDHPRLDLLRLRALSVHRDFGDQPWLATRDALSRVRRGWRQLAPINDWIATYLGTATH
ncbi:MAG: DUF2461 domain-containing protein [Geodermatophilaceae bacterium]|nr:DUF2461 domain-containing protein [Geodermatophilaceae bacterium]